MKVVEECVDQLTHRRRLILVRCSLESIADIGLEKRRLNNLHHHRAVSAAVCKGAFPCVSRHGRLVEIHYLGRDTEEQVMSPNYSILPLHHFIFVVFTAILPKHVLSPSNSSYNYPVFPDSLPQISQIRLYKQHKEISYPLTYSRIVQLLEPSNVGN